ncbi:hypothetical protein V1T76_05640 [Roseibium sp. FZY0029]|uniref:hypothetical protein n=1 Tax=Roseibium sp. FZY0029 TaxID=3116647 RepID=UPI002EA403E1|nr:hypothetical protein [Roseibium sp. FZY0029]
MNRKLTAETSSSANLLPLSDPLAMRALRAMVPDGGQKPVAKKKICNVITLHDECTSSSPAGIISSSHGGKVLAAESPAVRSRTEAAELCHEQ